MNPHNVFIHPAEDRHHEAIMNGADMNVLDMAFGEHGRISLGDKWVGGHVDGVKSGRCCQFSKVVVPVDTPPAVHGYSCQHWTFLHMQRKDLG